jgi:hypothetical protein
MPSRDLERAVGWTAVIVGTVALAVLLVTGPPPGDVRPVSPSPIVAVTPASEARR